MKYFFGSSDKRLRVLMYHKIAANGDCDFLTVPSTQLEAQFSYLQKENYTPLLFSDLINYTRQRTPLPPRPVLITFDDGYRDNYTVMYPLLKKYGMKANIFLVPSFLQDGYKQENDMYLHVEDIGSMDPSLVQFGLHSYDHKSYKTLTAKEVDADIVQAKASLIALGIRFQPCLAYPYGAYPKNNPLKQYELFETLILNNIVLAFRIGNRLNTLPLRNPLLVQRLDIRGDASFEKFSKQLKRGKSLF